MERSFSSSSVSSLLSPDIARPHHLVRSVAAVAEEPSLPERKVEAPPVVVVMRAVDLNKNESRPQDQETVR